MVVQWNGLLLVWTSLPQMHFLAPVLGKAHGAHLATSKRFRATVVGTRTSTAKPCPYPCTAAKYYQKCSPNTPGAEKTLQIWEPIWCHMNRVMLPLFYPSWRMENQKHHISNVYPCLTSSTAQGGGGSFKNRKPIGEIGCCESRMAERIYWWTERYLRSPLFLSLSLTIYLPTYLPTYLSIYLSLSLSFICLSV